MTKNQKMLFGLGIVAFVGIVIYKQSKKNNFAGAGNFFKSHSQNCSGLNCA